MTAHDVNDVRARFELVMVSAVSPQNNAPYGTFPSYEQAEAVAKLLLKADAEDSPEWCGYLIDRAAHADMAGEVREWRSIETPPAVASTASHPVLVCVPKFGVRMGWYTKAYADKGEWPWSADGFCDLTNQTITYWMPRPEPPAALAKFHPDRRAANYVSGHVDDAGTFHPTHQEKPRWARR